jgi:colanic acid biosynthesis glycosyl transferase WcaI
MRVVVHDYAGHPFQVELSRSLARRGHEVLHLYSASILTPQGALKRRDDDPVTFAVEPIVLPKTVDKGNLWKRRESDREHGALAMKRIVEFRPDVILASNTPLDCQKLFIEHCRADGRRFVFWVQDLIGQAAKRLLKDRLPLVGPVVGALWVKFEERLLAESDAVVVISEDFKPFLPASALGRTTVIENWAPLAEVPTRSKDNDWSRRQGLAETPVVLYSGTLGMKHNPELLVQVAVANPDARMVVVSEGSTVDWLRDRVTELGLPNVTLLPFQPFAELPDMLASADVLVAVLEPEAGVFSVPSKVLTYLCAGRPIVMAVPPENLAARIVASNGAGAVVPPSDQAGFVAAVSRMLADGDAQAEAGQRARAYAERTFDIEAITDRFEQILKG